MSLRSPVSIALYTNLVVTFCVALVAILAAFRAVDLAVERAAREDISREIAIMLERTPERNIIPDTAILTTNIGRRMFADSAKDGGWVYLLASSEGDVIVGNAKRMPSAEPNIWKEVTGQDLGIDSSRRLGDIDEALDPEIVAGSRYDLPILPVQTGVDRVDTVAVNARSSSQEGSAAG